MASRACSSALLRDAITCSRNYSSSQNIVNGLSHLSKNRVQTIRCGHTVRVILTKDLPNGKGYAGEVHKVRAGFARNHLIPLKKALYAIPQNFERVGIIDPELVDKKPQKQERSREEEEHLKAADVLRHYLRNKVLKIWRHAEDVDSSRIHPGVVVHSNIREKLSKQLMIDLEDHEVVQLSADTVSHIELEDEGEMANALKSFPDLEEGQDCQVKIKKLGEYLAKIHLSGGFSVGLRVNVLKQ